MIAHYDHYTKREPHYLTDHVEEMLLYLKELTLSKDIEVLAEICIIAHDLGKKSLLFQKYVQDPNGKRGTVKHAVGGAYALSKQSINLSPAEQMISYFAQLIVAAHHTSLSDATGNAEDLFESFPKELEGIEKLTATEVSKAIKKLSEFPIEEFKEKFKLGEEGSSYLATLIRFAMSVMIDADWLSTEAYFSEERAAKRVYKVPSFEFLQQELTNYYTKEDVFPDSTEQLIAIKKALQKRGEESWSKETFMFHFTCPNRRRENNRRVGICTRPRN